MASENDRIIRIDYNFNCDVLFDDNRYLADFIIGVKDGTQIYAHRYFLAKVSKFFKRKLDLIPTLEYFLLPDQFRSDIIKFVIFCMYKRYVCIRKTDLIAFLQAVKYLQLVGLEEVQMSNLECEKKLCVKIKRLTHEELETAMAGKCNDQSHQIGNDSRRMTKATTKLEEKSVKKSKKMVTVEKSPSNESVESTSQHVSKQNARPKDEISEVTSTTKRKSKKDDDVKLTQESRRWQIKNKGRKKYAFNGFTIEVKSNNNELKPARKSRRVTKGVEKTRISTAKNTKMENEKPEPSLNQTNDSNSKEVKQAEKEAVYVFDDSSDEVSSRKSTSKSTKGGASTKDDFKPPQKPQHKREAKNGAESAAKITKKEKEKPKSSTNQSIGKTENEQEQEKLSKTPPSNMNETFIIATRRQPVRACNAQRNALLSCINEDLDIEEIDSGISLAALAERERQRKMPLKEKENLPPHSSSRMANISNRKKLSTANINRRTVKKSSNQITSAESDDVTEKNIFASKVDEFIVPEDGIHVDQIFGDISYDSSVEIPIESIATPKEEPRMADRKPVSVQVVGSTPKPDGSQIKAPTRKATPTVSHNNVTETPLRKMPKRKRSIFGKPSKYNLSPSGTSSSHSQSRNEIPCTRSKSRLLLLSGTTDSGSESGGFKAGIWKFESQSSIDSVE